jgi:hypothetical protein
MTLMEQETLLNSKGKPWASLKHSFAAARDRQIGAVHEDTTMPEAWKGDIEQAHRDNYARLIDTLVKLFKSCLTERPPRASLADDAL